MRAIHCLARRRARSSLLLATVGVSCLFAVPASASAADWFIDNDTGDDANLATNCQIASPCKSIAPAVGILQAGDTVKVDDSPTSYQLDNLSLFNDLSLVGGNFIGGLESSDGRPVIVGTGGVASKIFAVNALDSATSISNLRLRPNGGTGIQANGPIDTISDNVFEDTGANLNDRGISIGGSSPSITDNTMIGMNLGVAVLAGSPVIARNDISGAQDGSIGGAGILVQGGASDLRANRIHDPGAGVPDGIRLFEAAATLERNEISGHDSGVSALNTPGVISMSGDQITGATGAIGAGLLLVDGDDNGDTIVDATNVTVVAGVSAHSDVELDGGSLTLDSSIVGAPGSPGVTATTNTPECTISFSRGPTTTPGGTGCGNFQTTADPSFADAAAGNFHLAAGSPMIDAGNPAAPTATVDIDGNARVLDGDNNGSAIRDIGADERVFVSTPPPPPVDTKAPQTTITKGPKAKSKDKTPTFIFKSSESGSTFQCKIDGKPFSTCASPFTSKKLKAGKHSFQVRATDKAGNTDATPAQQKFKIKKKKKKGKGKKGKKK